jgi:heat shock protein HtpX
MRHLNTLGGRAVLALALMVSFYGLALGVSLALLSIAYADMAYLTHHIWRVSFFCVVAAGSILLAIVPRPDRFEPPGPRVTSNEEPRLFDAIEAIAAATGQSMPKDVYMVNAVNAFVTQRGGIMGIGSRRVMGLGLPLMQVLTVDEFKSVLAHEFGHYHAGDVALAPWIYKTRAAIGRTIERLSSNVLQAIFVAYGNLFLRITHGVSRRQEFIADEVAARAIGAAPTASGLRKVHGAAIAHASYWSADVVPVLDSGHVAPISEGFAHYMRSAPVVSFVNAVLAHEETRGEAKLYDTHPSLRERLSALASLPQGSSAEPQPAIALLRDIDLWERRLLASASLDYVDLKRLSWSEVAEAVYVPEWRRRMKQHGRLLEGCTMASVPATRSALVSIGGRILHGHGEVPEHVRLQVGAQLLISAIGLALVSLGWNADVTPGSELTLHRNGEVLRPLSELTDAIDGRESLDRWRQRCADLRIAEVVLGKTTAASG